MQSMLSSMGLFIAIILPGKPLVGNYFSGHKISLDLLKFSKDEFQFWHSIYHNVDYKSFLGVYNNPESAGMNYKLNMKHWNMNLYVAYTGSTTSAMISVFTFLITFPRGFQATTSAKHTLLCRRIGTSI